MSIFYFIKPSYTEFLEFGNFYVIVLNSFNSFILPKFILAKSQLSFIKNKLVDSINFLRTLYQILHVKGIGFKVYYYKTEHSLYFNLGYNHLCKYNLDNFTGVKVRKHFLLIYSKLKIDFCYSLYQIRALREPDPYRGKGIRIRFQQLKFKPGKQR